MVAYWSIAFKEEEKKKYTRNIKMVHVGVAYCPGSDEPAGEPVWVQT
jgi:hypothetical protein